MNLSEERLAYLSERLRLPDMPALVPMLAEQAAAKEWSFSDFAEALLAAQVEASDARACETLQRLASFPTKKTLESFDFAFQPSVNRKQIAELASCAFIERAENVVLLGPPGVGKTHLAIALGLEATKRRLQVKFTTAARLVASLSEARSAGTFSRRVSTFVRPSLLIVDEVGFLPLDASEASLLFEVVCRRYERGSIVLTSNKSYGEWGEVFSGDTVIATAILDRLLHHFHDDLDQGPELPAQGQEEGRHRHDTSRLRGSTFNRHEGVSFRPSLTRIATSRTRPLPCHLLPGNLKQLHPTPIRDNDPPFAFAEFSASWVSGVQPSQKLPSLDSLRCEGVARTSSCLHVHSRQQ